MLSDLSSRKTHTYTEDRVITRLNLPVRTSYEDYIFFKVVTVYGGDPIKCVGVFNQWYCIGRD